jgi:rhodanese-related sulfurtransferase
MIMAAEVDRDRLQSLVNAGASLVDVLPESEYDTGHLPGAISIPLAKFPHGGIEALPRDHPVIVYCADNE